MKTKNGKILLILAIAVLFGLIGTVSLVMYLTPKKTTIYVFNDNYISGTRLQGNMLTSIQCDSSAVVGGAKASTSSVFITGADIQTVLDRGESLRMDVAEGMPLTLSLLSVTGGTSLEQNLDPTKIAVTVPVTSISGISSSLQKNSRVNVYATGFNDQGTTLLFQNMRVLSTAKDSNGNLGSVTLEVDTEQSMKLIYAANYSAIYLGLINGEGYKEVAGEYSYMPAGADNQ